MSLYEVERLLHEFNRSRALLERFRQEPEAALEGYALEEAERRALATGDVAALWQMGVHPQLLLGYSRFAGPRDEVRRRLEPLVGTRQIRSTLPTAKE